MLNVSIAPRVTWTGIYGAFNFRDWPISAVSDCHSIRLILRTLVAVDGTQMQEIDIKTWEEFEDQISRRLARQTAKSSCVSGYLFRGQSDSAWTLATTLERFTNRLLTMEEYYRILLKAKPQIETFTGATWNEMPDLSEYMKSIGNGFSPVVNYPGFEYAVYVRHLGFPSPLLDWTRSPYIAAYFAFREVGSTAKIVSIYAFCEYTEKIKLGSVSDPKISGFGQYVHSHRRHFQQQSQYTICTKHVDGKHCYATHEDVFADNRSDQDELSKFNIPSSERPKFLKRLEQYNINAFSLFGSAESLMETLSLNEIYLVSCSS